MYGPNQELTTISSESGDVLVFVAQSANQPPDFWAAEIDAGRFSPRQLTHINPQLERYSFGKSMLIEWHSLGGDLLRGAVLLPSEYHPGQRYPMVVWVYGGSELSNKLNVFGGFQIEFGAIDNMQLLTTRGYAVLFPDAPLRTAPMRDLAYAVLPGINKTVELGIADPDRLGLLGESFGGYSTLALITQTSRFRAALMRSGWGDNMAAYNAMSDNGSSFMLGVLESGQGRMGGTPWEYRDRYIENSPIFYLNEVQLHC